MSDNYSRPLSVTWQSIGEEIWLQVYDPITGLPLGRASMTPLEAHDFAQAGQLEALQIGITFAERLEAQKESKVLSFPKAVETDDV